MRFPLTTVPFPFHFLPLDELRKQRQYLNTAAYMAAVEADDLEHLRNMEKHIAVREKHGKEDALTNDQWWEIEE